ncbi:MAG: ABC transporter permease [Gemmatimonadetes bacterium]|nr:ABC transporter permease [Gemmatimonadota bacterium]
MIADLVGSRSVRRALGAAGIVATLAFSAPWLSPYDPNEHLDAVELRIAGPSWHHPLGTDLFSRDVLSRVLYGTRVSLTVAALSVLVSVTLGTAVGMAAWLAGGAVDTVLMRLVDGALAIPRILLLLVIAALWNHINLAALVAILGLTSWFGTSRVVRAEVLSARAREYVAAARSLGLSRVRIATQHVLPNIAGPILVAASLGVGQIILVEAGLSFLGLGLAPPTASLGAMIQEGQSFVYQAPWVVVAPGVVIVLTVLVFSALGESLREALDPRSGGRPA